MANQIGVGLYGINGHQLHAALVGHPHAVVVAHAGIPEQALPEAVRSSARHLASLNELLADPSVELVSLCSPRRADQAADAIRCLEAGRHVYAEKPCALSEPDLDRILAAAGRAGRRFHEMAGSAFEQPYRAMRDLVRAGGVGDVVQVFAQKSYPMHDNRPRDEGVDGGLMCQVGVHAVRFVEHVTGLRTTSLQAVETTHANGGKGDLRRAASIQMRLDNGALATAIMNYCNPAQAFGSWGNEHLRVFGTRGFVESADAGRRTRLVLDDGDRGPLPTGGQPSVEYHDLVLASILGLGAMPHTLDEELHPTRVVLRAKAAADSARQADR